MNSDSILVSIVCLTYNHGKFIRDAIEGFLMQKTNFPIEIIIHDDASTDETAHIIRDYEKKYPKRIEPIYQKENQFSKGIRPLPVLIWPKCSGKYIAICEGDDYWTDPYKLQKQVDFLEANPDYGMVHSDCDFYYEKHSKRIKNYHSFINSKIPVGTIFEDLLIRDFIVTCTVCLRTDLLKKYLEEDMTNKMSFKMGDLPLWLEFAKSMKVGYLSESLATYRVSEGTMSRPQDLCCRYEFEKSAFQVRKYYIDKYGCSNIARETVDINFEKVKLKFAYLLNNKEESKEIYEFLKRHQQHEKLHRDYFFYKWGTLNVINRLIAQCYFDFIRYKRLTIRHRRRIGLSGLERTAVDI